MRSTGCGFVSGGRGRVMSGAYSVFTAHTGHVLDIRLQIMYVDIPQSGDLSGGTGSSLDISLATY